MTGRLVVVSGPSGAGKSTLVRMLLDRRQDLWMSVSATTRSPRPGEVDGRDYHFVPQDRFEQMREQGMLLESASYAGNYYGTPRGPVEAHLRTGQSVILEIELVGARQVRRSMPESVLVFIAPPSVAELERRLAHRDTETEAQTQARLQRAREELDAAEEFDAVVVNRDLDHALAELERIVG